MQASHPPPDGPPLASAVSSPNNIANGNRDDVMATQTSIPTADDKKPSSAVDFVAVDSTSGDEGIWECPACTFVNENPLHLACDICGAPKYSDRGTPKLANQASSNDIEKQSMKPELVERDEDDGPMPSAEQLSVEYDKPARKGELIEGGDDPMPVEQFSAGDMIMDAASGATEKKPKIVTDNDDELPESRGHDGEASATQNTPTEQEQQPPTVARSLLDVARGSSAPSRPGENPLSSQSTPVASSPPPSTARQHSDPSIAYFPGLDVRLVEDEPSVPYVDAIPIQINDDDTNDSEDTNNIIDTAQPEQSWWKQHQRLIILMMFVIICALVAIMGASLLSKNNNASSEESAPKISSPHKEPTFSRDETTEPTKQPTQQSVTLPSLPFPTNSDHFNTNQNVSQSETAGTEETSTTITRPPSKEATISPVKSNQPTNKPTQQSGITPDMMLPSNNANTKEAVHPFLLILDNLPGSYNLSPSVESGIILHLKDTLNKNLDESFELIDVTLNDSSNNHRHLSSHLQCPRRLNAITWPFLVTVRVPADIPPGWELLYILSAFQDMTELEVYLKSLDEHAFSNVSITVITPDQPTKFPTGRPTTHPTNAPTKAPTPKPTDLPTKKPTNLPTYLPTKLPTKVPTKNPTNRPSKQPTRHPTPMPTESSDISPGPHVWIQQGQAIAGDAAGDQAGRSVHLSADGMTLAIGAPGDPTDDRRGYVKVYYKESQDSMWKQLGSDIEGQADGDNMGWSLSLSANGRTLAIGAMGYFEKKDRPGYVRVYFMEDAVLSWKQLGKDIIGQATGDQFGHSVSLSSDGKTVAIGANTIDGNGDSSGQVRVYRIDHIGTGVSWKQLGQDINGEAAGDNSGNPMAISGDGETLAIGAYWNDGNGDKSGHVRVYEMRDDGTGPSWEQVGQDIDGQASDDRFGIAVALSSDGKTLAIGATAYPTSREGYVRVYHRVGDGSTSSFQQLGQTIVGEAPEDLFGRSVALSQDGKTPAVGANGNDDNGNISGHGRVYHMDSSGSQWTQLGQDINGEKAGDEAGWRVSLSANGKTLAIGSISNDDNGDKSGHVRVFSIDE